MIKSTNIIISTRKEVSTLSKGKTIRGTVIQVMEDFNPDFSNLIQLKNELIIVIVLVFYLHCVQSK